jgi:hypothetical protein
MRDLMARLRLVDENDGVAGPGDFRAKPETIAAARAIIASFENPPPIDGEVMRTICRWIHRTDKFGIGDGRGHAAATLRVFLGAPSTVMLWPNRSSARWHPS